MPIFEYLCEDCGNKFEKLVRRSASKWRERRAVPVLRPGASQAAVLDLRRARQRRVPSARRHAFLSLRDVPHAGSVRAELGLAS